MNYKVLAINPGSTSTKVACYENEQELFRKNIEHDADTLATYANVHDQLAYRRDTILSTLADQGIKIDDCAAFVGRGGGLQSCEGGVYDATPLLLAHASSGKYGGNHPAALGSQIADGFAKEFGGNAYVVNPPDTDEFCDLARITGLADIYRSSHIHALNQKETALRVAADMGLEYQNANFVVAHIGGGVSITAHQAGHMIDSNDIINGEGPMAPTRAGALPAKEFMDLCYSGAWSRDEMYTRLTKTGGFVDHLGTSSAIEVVEKIHRGDKYAELVYHAFTYQIIKAIGAMAAALSGDVQAIILTGGIAKDADLVQRITSATSFIAPVMIRAGEFEMEALANGALRVLRGDEKPKVYTGEPVFSGFEHLKSGVHQ